MVNLNFYWLSVFSVNWEQRKNLQWLLKPHNLSKSHFSCVIFKIFYNTWYLHTFKKIVKMWLQMSSLLDMSGLWYTVTFHLEWSFFRQPALHQWKRDGFVTQVKDTSEVVWFSSLSPALVFWMDTEEKVIWIGA